MTMTTSNQVVAVIADIVGSRTLGDRDAAQRAVPEAFARADRLAGVSPVRAGWPTVGDEFQAVYRTWQDAVRVTLRLPAVLPEQVRLRLGLGLGEHRVMEDDAAGHRIEDGTAWYRAREAIETAEARGAHGATAFLAEDADLTAAVDGLVLLQDHVLGRLKVRELRLLRALLDGATQAEAARAEKISQSAVSQAMSRSGATRLIDLDAALASSSGADGAA